MEKIKIGIVGYGNLGKGVELAVKQNSDIELVAIFTRRNPKDILGTSVPVYSIDKAITMKDKIDVMILCGGSATDLPIQGPEFAATFNTIDSFDTHAKIPDYFEKMNTASHKANKVSIISVGWDPGLFSLSRIYFDSVLPFGKTYTFWGKGVSQGHSDAIRRISGVKNAVQYTIPINKAIQNVKSGLDPELTTAEKHIRECFVVLKDGANKEIIEEQIKTMPNYFDEYETTVHFISEEELKEKHSAMPHGGFVIRSGKTGVENSTKQIAEFSLSLESNPEFTASVLISYARAAFRLEKLGNVGAKTVFDIPPVLLSIKSEEELRRELL